MYHELCFTEKLFVQAIRADRQFRADYSRRYDMPGLMPEDFPVIDAAAADRLYRESTVFAEVVLKAEANVED